MAQPEQAPRTPEQAKAPELNLEQYDKAAEQLERNVEKPVESAEVAAERAKVEALESAVSVEAAGAERAATRPHEGPSAPVRKRKATKKEQSAAYKQRMAHVQAEMKPGARAFSKVIHNPAVEATSETLGATIARPNAILAGAVSAFVLVLAVYLIAKNFGYVLSGFETIAAFIVGWVLGVVYDYLRVMITGKK